MMKQGCICTALLLSMFVLHIGLVQAEIDPATVQKLLAEDSTAGDLFGRSVVVSGNTAIIGSPLDDDKGADSGSAYVFVRAADGSWTQQAKLLAEDGVAGDRLGMSVAMFEDTAIIGADNNGGGDASGAAYVFVRAEDGSWMQQDKLLADDGAAGDLFGYSVAVSGDTAIIGAFYDDANYTDSGSAYVFVRAADGSWTQQAKLLAADGAAADRFGMSVAVSGDTAIIGAPWDDDRGASTGSAYVFVRAADGSWIEQTKLLAADGAADDWFGRSVKMSGDTAVIGSPLDNDKGTDSGSAYIFVRVADSSWIEQTKLLAADGTGGDRFGVGVAVSRAENTVVIGAYWDDDKGTDSGSAYIFVRAADGSWTQQDKLLADNGAAGDYFGHNVSVDRDTAMIGGYLSDPDGLTNAGAVYVFSSSNTPPVAAAMPWLYLLLL